MLCCLSPYLIRWISILSKVSCYILIGGRNTKGLHNFNILFLLAKHFGRPLSVYRLEKEVIPSLQSAGLIIEDRDPHDKRKKIFYPTLLSDLVSEDNRCENNIREKCGQKHSKSTQKELLHFGVINVDSVENTRPMDNLLLWLRSELDRGINPILRISPVTQIEHSQCSFCTQTSKSLPWEVHFLNITETKACCIDCYGSIQAMILDLEGA